jgi:hypothetical protein
MTLKGLPELARGDAAKGLRGLAVSRGEMSWRVIVARSSVPHGGTNGETNHKAMQKDAASSSLSFQSADDYSCRSASIGFIYAARRAG